MSNHLAATVRSTLTRDFSLLLQRRIFWWFLALWASVTAVIFFTYLDNFLAIQPTLRAKNIRYGVTDIVMMPYLKSSGMVAMVFICCLCCRLFYHEQFSPFSLTHRSLQPPPVGLIIAKWTYVALLSLVTLIIVLLPVIACAWLFDYHTFRVVIMTLALFMLLLAVGGMTMVLSQRFTHSILTVLVTLLFLTLSEVAASTIHEPDWLNAILTFISPLSHLQHIATGVVTLADGVFCVLLIGLLCALSLRQYTNSYLYIH